MNHQIGICWRWWEFSILKEIWLQKNLGHTKKVFQRIIWFHNILYKYRIQFLESDIYLCFPPFGVWIEYESLSVKRNGHELIYHLQFHKTLLYTPVYYYVDCVDEYLCVCRNASVKLRFTKSRGFKSHSRFILGTTTLWCYAPLLFTILFITFQPSLKRIRLYYREI